MTKGLRGFSTNFLFNKTQQQNMPQKVIVWIKKIFNPIWGGLFVVKFMFYVKATKIDKIFTVDLTLCSNCQIDGEDFVDFCGLVGKRKVYTQTSPLSKLSLIFRPFFQNGTTFRQARFCCGIASRCTHKLN